MIFILLKKNNLCEKDSAHKHSNHASVHGSCPMLKCEIRWLVNVFPATHFLFHQVEIVSMQTVSIQTLNHQDKWTSSDRLKVRIVQQYSEQLKENNDQDIKPAVSTLSNALHSVLCTSNFHFLECKVKNNCFIRHSQGSLVISCDTE